jgi:hypothetical protein
MMRPWIVLDVATAPIEGAVDFLEPVSAPSRWKDQTKIAAYVAEKTAERADGAALDLDLSRVTAIGCMRSIGTVIEYFPDEDVERKGFADLVEWLRPQTIDDLGYADQPTIITYGGHRFDLPLLMRRARYLGVKFPTLNTDRFKSPHVDLCDLLSDRDPTRRRSLNFYVKRLGWTDLADKPLTGAEEAQVFEHGRWDDLAASVRRDVEATYRLAVWLGVIG